MAYSITSARSGCRLSVLLEDSAIFNGSR